MKRTAYRGRLGSRGRPEPGAACPDRSAQAALDRADRDTEGCGDRRDAVAGEIGQLDRAALLERQGGAATLDRFLQQARLDNRPGIVAERPVLGQLEGIIEAAPPG